MNYSDYQYHYIDDASTHQLFTGRGMLHSIVITEAAAGTIKIIDGTSGSTANVATLKASLAEGTYKFDCSISTGLRIITGAATKITVMWAQ